MIIEQMSKKITNRNGVPIVTNYKDAVDWLHNDYILCNKIPEIDQSIYDNARFSWNQENDDGTESDDMIEVYQWFLTSANEWDVQYLEKRFGLLFTYSDLLDCYVLCVTHYGTAWDYVYNQDSEMDSYAKKQIEELKSNKA